MLEAMATNGSQHVVSWQPHGQAFRVHQPEVFARTIMARYFKQTNYKSFLRQLNIYGYRRINKGMDNGAYYHSHFIRNKNSMSLRMVREKIKGAGNSKKRREIEDPDFYKQIIMSPKQTEHKREQILCPDTNCVPVISMERQNLPPCYNYNKEASRDFATMATPNVAPTMVMAPKQTGDKRGQILYPGTKWLPDISMERQNPPCYNYNYNYNYNRETSRDLTTMATPDEVLTCTMADFSGATAKKNTYGTTCNLVGSVVKEHLEEGDEVFFEGKRFHFVELLSTSFLP
jgi:hypothetical protein